MYHTIVKSIIKSNFNHLSNGNYNALLNTVSDQVEHKFLGGCQNVVDCEDDE